jgi:hypothetical protein
MKRKDFLLTSLLAIPGIGIAKEPSPEKITTPAKNLLL